MPAREEVGEFTKRLRPHLESLSPTDAVRLLQALEALDYNPPAKPWQAQPPASSQPTRTGKAGKADTAQPAADAGFPPSGAEVIGRLMVMVDGLGSRGGGGGGLAAAPSDLILELLRSCAAWSVPFPETYLGVSAISFRAFGSGCAAASALAVVRFRQPDVPVVDAS